MRSPAVSCMGLKNCVKSVMVIRLCVSTFSGNDFYLLASSTMDAMLDTIALVTTFYLDSLTAST